MGNPGNNKRSTEVFSSNRQARLVAIVAAALIAPGIADAQGSGSERSITVTGTGEAWGRPDQAQVSAGVQTRATTVAEAARSNQVVLERIMAALGEQGIEAADIQTANYSIWPEQNHGDPRQGGAVEIIGYRVSNMVNVKVRDIEKVGEVIGAVTEAGANSVHGVQFMVEDAAALEESARKAAMADAKARAESLAELAGVRLGEVRHISLNHGGGWQPYPMAARMEAADAAVVPGISPGQQSVSVQVQVSFALR